MSDPDRPTREQVDVALRRADELSDWSAKTDRAVLSAEVRALRAELDEVHEFGLTLGLRPAPHVRLDVAAVLSHARDLVARTPQPADDSAVHAEACRVIREAWAALPPLVAHLARAEGATLAGCIAALPAPLPAVPDGEKLRTWPEWGDEERAALTDAVWAAAGEDAPKVNVNYPQSGCPLCGSTERHQHGQAEWQNGKPPDADDAHPPHLVNAAAPAMRTLMRRISSRQVGSDDAVDMLLSWPNLDDVDGEADDRPVRWAWAAWLAESAEQADDLDDAERHGLRIAATHLLEDDIAARLTPGEFNPVADPTWALGFSARLWVDVEAGRSARRAIRPAGGEDAVCSCCNGDPLTVCAACEQHACWAGIMYCEDYRTAGTKQATAATDGEDVPARLDAAAEALDDAGMSGYWSATVRDLARRLRDLESADVRAAVAAALARPTGDVR